jgi:mRNA interferase RelE/StbE
MTWRVEFAPRAYKAFARIDKAMSKRIMSKLDEVSKLDNPRDMGDALTGNLAGLWRYRVGDYRVICSIEDDVIVIFVVDIDHRRQVYRT